MVDFNFKMDKKSMDRVNKSWREYQAVSNKGFEDDVKKQVSAWAFDLFVISKAIGKKAQKKIKQLSAGNLRVRNNARSKAQEKARRIFATGFVSTGWLVAFKKFASKPSNPKMLNEVENLEGDGFVTVGFNRAVGVLINRTPGVQEMERKHNVTQKSVRRRQRDMDKYVRIQNRKRAKEVWGKAATKK